MRLVHASLGKRLGLQRVDGGPKSAYRLPFGALYELRGQNSTEKLIAAATETSEQQLDIGDAWTVNSHSILLPLQATQASRRDWAGQAFHVYLF